jgi:hypothetical protein
MAGTWDAHGALAAMQRSTNTSTRLVPELLEWELSVGSPGSTRPALYGMRAQRGGGQELGGQRRGFNVVAMIATFK